MNEKNERKVDNLINLVENHTRTERHLEQYSHIGNPKYKEMAREKLDMYLPNERVYVDIGK